MIHPHNLTTDELLRLDPQTDTERELQRRLTLAQGWIHEARGVLIDHDSAAADELLHDRELEI